MESSSSLVAKWLKKKRNAYQRRKHRIISELLDDVKRNRSAPRPFLRSKTVDQFAAPASLSEESLSDLDKYDGGTGWSDRRRAVSAWFKQKTSTPLAGAIRHKFTKPRIHVEKVQNLGTTDHQDSIMLSQERRSKDSPKIGGATINSPLDYQTTGISFCTESPPSSDQQNQESSPGIFPVRKAWVSQDKDVTNTHQAKSNNTARADGRTDSYLHPTGHIAFKMTTGIRSDSPTTERQANTIRAIHTSPSRLSLHRSPASSRSITPRRQSNERQQGGRGTPRPRSDGQQQNRLALPSGGMWDARRRSPSPRSRVSTSGSWISRSSSRTTSVERSSGDECDMPIWRFSRGRTFKRRRDSFAGTTRSLSAKDTVVRTAIPNVRRGFKPLIRFRRAVKSVQVLLRAIDRSSSYGSSSQTSSVLSWLQIHSDLEKHRRDRASGLMFDPSDYRAKRETQLSSEAKAILSMDPSARTPEQLHAALVALNQSVQAFSEFPIKMQESLVRVGFFEHFEAKRVIIRQGHVADNFYLVLSGMAIVTILETDKNGTQNVRTAAFLKKGNSFGELALMHGSLRSATVTCKDSVELLAVGRQDFINIFMHVEKNKVPEHIQFLRTIDVFQGWPIDRIPYNHPDVCIFTYFRRGVLLCKDSNLSDWIYIIRSGACKVLKAVKINKFEQKAEKGQHLAIQATPISSKVQSRCSKKGPPYLARQSKGSASNKSRPRAKRKIQWVRPRGKEELKAVSTEHLDELNRLFTARHPPRNPEDDDLDSELEWLRSDSDSGFTCSAGQSPPTHTEISNPGGTDTDVLCPRCGGFLGVCSCAEVDEFKSPSENGDNRDQTDEHNVENGKRQLEPDTVFVQVTRLGPKDVFGMEQPVLSILAPTTSLSLVSDGAECVLLNRRFFMQHLPDAQLKRLRLTMQPYPTEEELERKLSDQRKWKAFKSIALNNHLSFTRHLQQTLSLYY